MAPATAHLALPSIITDINAKVGLAIGANCACVELGGVCLVQITDSHVSYVGPALALPLEQLALRDECGVGKTFEEQGLGGQAVEASSGNECEGLAGGRGAVCSSND